MFDPKSVSEMLDIPGSTLRRYCADYADLLSETARVTGRKRRYTNDDLLVLRRIKELTRNRKSPDEIRAAAAAAAAETETDVKSALVLIPAIAAEFEQLRSQIARLQSDQDENRAAIEQLRRELAARRPWWAKIIRRNKS